MINKCSIVIYWRVFIKLPLHHMFQYIVYPTDYFYVIYLYSIYAN